MRFEEIKLSNHARKRMRQRNIPRNQILVTLNDPERVYPSGDKMVAERSTGAGNMIQVIYVERQGDRTEEDAFIVSLVRKSGNVE